MLWLTFINKEQNINWNDVTYRWSSFCLFSLFARFNKFNNFGWWAFPCYTALWICNVKRNKTASKISVSANVKIAECQSAAILGRSLSAVLNDVRITFILLPFSPLDTSSLFWRHLAPLEYLFQQFHHRSDSFNINNTSFSLTYEL